MAIILIVQCLLLEHTKIISMNLLTNKIPDNNILEKYMNILNE